MKKILAVSFLIFSASCFAVTETTMALAANKNVVASSCSINRKLLFRDFFTFSKNRNWTFYNRKGRIAKGKLWMDGGYMSNSVGQDGWILTHIGDTAWTDYTYQSLAESDFMWTLYFRIAAQKDNSRQTTMYRLDIFNPYNMASTSLANGICPRLNRGIIWLGKYENGIISTLMATCISNTTVGTNQAAITVKAGDISVRMNGKTVLKYTDPNPILYGGVGVGEIWENNGWYDNISVSTLPPE